MTPNHPPHNGTITYVPTSASDSKFVDTVRSNVKSDLIEITEDKLENILLKHLRSCDTRWAWLAPMSAFLSLLLATTTTTCIEKFGVKAATWEAIFLLLCVASFIWLMISLARMAMFWNETTLSHLVATIKKADGAK